MNLDFTSSNRALIRALDPKDLNFVAQNNSAQALLLFVPGIRSGDINVKNEGKADLIVEHCRAQIIVPAGEAKDLVIKPGDLVDPNAPVPETPVVAKPEVKLPPRLQAIRDAQAAKAAKPVGLGAKTVVSDVVKPTRPPGTPIMSTVKIRKRA